MNPVEIAQGINHALLETTTASTAALLLVLLMRRRMRTVFGASVAYAAWLLVPIASIAVLLPAPAADTMSIPVVYTLVAQPMQAVITGAETGISIATWLCAAWLLGAMTMLVHFIRQQRRFRTSLGRLFVREADVLQADATAGLPAAIGWFNPVIVLPADFDTRYSAEQRELMLAHERAHIRHGDLQANAAFLALRCVFWFNPLLHVAARAFRHDQELACDQRVIARHPQSRRAYGEAMFRTQLATQALPLGCHWGFTHPLKERIEMLKLPAPSMFRWLSGSALVVVLTLGFGLAAWSAQPESHGSADTKITITLTDVTLGEAIDKVVAEAGLHLGTPDVLRLKNKMSFSFRDEPIRNVLELFGEEAGLTPEISDGLVSFLKQAEPVRGVSLPVPTYPKEALDRSQGGKVILLVDVAADGSVSNAVVDHSEPAGAFDAVALKAVKKWKFTPAMKDGKAIASRIRVPVEFRTDGDPDAKKS
ncbi:TonB family protein [Thermomonas sp.]|uniref:TonB family protein n=1 Tax=Thermomonas sp. TaxID=1971895 RepID=UPI0024893555|nr:TonB family protein [Thermomonas sp.]MDI1251774.1 TonB family protein [Thermomonas sp.]